MNKSVKALLFAILLAILGFSLFSVSVQASEGALLNRPSSVFVQGDYAYVVSINSNSLEVINISNPSAPTHTGSIVHGTDGAQLFQPSSVYVSGNYAYVTSPLGHSLEILDISDPANPSHVSTVYNGDNGAQLAGAYSVFVSGNYAYVVARNSALVDIIDVSDPMTPMHTGKFYRSSLVIPSSVYVSGNYMYVAMGILGSSGGALNVVDVSDPTQPVFKGELGDGTDGAIINSPNSVYVSGNYAYLVSVQGHSLEIVDVSDPSNPTHKGVIENGDGGANIYSPRSVHVSGNYAYVTSFVGNALEIVDISDPSNPTHKGKFYYEGEASYPISAVVSGDYAYVGLNSENAFDDISNPSNPVRKSILRNGELVGTPPPPVGCVVDCYSNVLFLPGLMGSRLYETTDIEHPLWVSSVDIKQAELTLDFGGKSINDVYTKNDTQRLDGDTDETGIVDDIFSFNIYQSFINDLKKWKEDDGIIEDYAFIPYDWRLSLNDIITNGSASIDGRLSYKQDQDFSQSFILQKLQELQTNSRTSKVTIIGHSNGGLVAKALIQKLKDTNNPLYDKIDKVIFVAVPQVGTPDAILGLLHGTDLGPGGFLMSDKRSRQLSENMSTIYNLLPSAGYFTTVDPAFAIDKVVSFENDPLFLPQTSQYGVFVSNETELENYILGTDGRTKPSFSDTLHPNIGNSVLYNQAQTVHQELDSWQPHPDTKVIQVAGWGEETVAGLSYKKYLKLGGIYSLSYKPNMVVDGDGTVVVPSALWMSESNSNVERWWVDLEQYNQNNFPDRVHRNILEIPNLTRFIEHKVKDIAFSDSIIVNNNSSLVADGERLHYTLHSPLTLGVEDSQGRYTGKDPDTNEVKEEIPGVLYKQIGEVQFISVPNEIQHIVKLKGYESGSFSLDVDKQEGNEIIEFTSFQGIPSTSNTVATMEVDANSDVSETSLKIDQNGDGDVDFNLLPKLGDVVTVPYKFSGFSQPINDATFYPGQAQSVFKAGSTVPVKFQLKKYDGTITQATTLPVWLTPHKGSPMSASIAESVYSLAGTSGNTYRWDATSQQYIYNWSTKGLSPGFWYRIYTKLDDGNTYSVTIGLR
jgi:pimeloyl-ACP methyl ester carboxylesterase